MSEQITYFAGAVIGGLIAAAFNWLFFGWLARRRATKGR